MSLINPGIFRQYDIRGVFGRDLTIEVAESIGNAYGIYLQTKVPAKPLRVTIGRDVRLSSNPLEDGLIRGVISTGVDVVDIGECTTPIQYFSLYHLNPDGGIMITGSHNPPEFNGFKISIGKETIYGEEIQEIRRIVEGVRGQPARRPPAGEAGRGWRSEVRGNIEQYEIILAYFNYLVAQFSDSIRKPIKVVVDAGNGTAGLVAPGVLRQLGCEVVELYCEPDGRFHHHHPDPTIPENLEDLIGVVKREKADLGVAYDGDADRIGVVDETGHIIWGDQLMVIFARDILEGQGARGKGQGLGRPTFVGEVKCSQVMYDEIKRLGGNAIMWKTGHSLIKKKMKEEGAILAGEMSGHIFFADRYFGYDDAIYATCRLVEILSKKRQGDRTTPFSSLLAGLPKTCTTPEIRIDCPDEEKFKVVERLGEWIEREREWVRVRDIIRIDGLRLIFENGWALVRASNTQPVLVLRFEATTEEGLKGIKGFVEEGLKTVISS